MPDQKPLLCPAFHHSTYSNWSLTIHIHFFLHLRTDESSQKYFPKLTKSSPELHRNCRKDVWDMRYPLSLTLPMLRLLSSKPQERKNLWKPSKPCHVGIHWIALDECSQMSTRMQGFQSYFRFLHRFVLAKLATSSIRVNIKKSHATFCNSSREK